MTLCSIFSFWVWKGYNYPYQDQNTKGQAPYYPPPAQAYPQPAGPPMYVSTPASAPPTYYPPVGYPQAAPQPQAQPQTIIYNQAPSGPPQQQQQQQEEVVAVGCLEGW